MKRLILLLLFLTGSMALFAQDADPLPSDHPSFYQPASAAKFLPTSGANPVTMTANVIGTTFPCGGGSDTLIFADSCAFGWFSDTTAAGLITNNDTMVTGNIFNDTTFYQACVSGLLDSIAPFPATSSNFCCNVRGYYFTAPIDFVITGLWVPEDIPFGVIGNQNMEVLRFANQTPPPLYSNSTNAFTSLGYWPNYNANDTVKVSIQVNAGDVIGIYGNRNDNNAYAPAPVASSIAGMPVTLTRSGMQSRLSAGKMANVFSENGGNISRVQMFYDVTPDTVFSTVDVIVPMPAATSAATSICQGDSIMLGGAFQTTAGTYMDTLLTTYGCDSIITTNLTMKARSSSTDIVSACDSLTWIDGITYTSSNNTATYILTNAEGCDSTVTLDLLINSVSDVSTAISGITITANNANATYQWLNCDSSFIAVSGETNQSLTPSVNGNYAVEITENGCADTSACVSITTVGITDSEFGNKLKVYPNPTTGDFHIDFGTDLQSVEFTITDILGRVIRSGEYQNTNSLDLNVNEAPGVYLVTVISDDKKAVIRLIKEQR